jgi:hypothetical protein
LAPCSHGFHYKCVVPLLVSEIMFICPLCRQVANLDNTAFLDDGIAVSKTPLENDFPEEEGVEEQMKAVENSSIAPTAAAAEEDVTRDIEADGMEIDAPAAPISITRPSIIIPAAMSANAGGALSPSTPKNDTLSQAVLQDAAHRVVRREQKVVLRSKLIKLAMEFPGFIKAEEVDALLDGDEDEELDV